MNQTVLTVLVMAILFSIALDLGSKQQPKISEGRAREIFCEQALKNRLLVWCDPTLTIAPLASEVPKSKSQH